MSSIQYDLVLEFLSAKQAGTWSTLSESLKLVSQTQEASTQWQPSIGITAVNFFTLAHIEVAFESDLRWSVCPAFLAALPDADNVQGVLGGFRTSRLNGAVFSAAEEAGARMQESIQRAAPSRIAVLASDFARLYEIARACAVPVLENPAFPLLQVTPSLRDLIASAVHEPPPSGFEIAKFHPGKRAWMPVCRIDGDGAYQFAGYRKQYRLIKDDTSLKVEKAVAAFSALAEAERSVISYDEETRILRLPAAVRPPRLYERAAVLCSCAVPSFDPRTASLLYTGVSPEFSRLFKAKLEVLQRVIG